MQPTNTKARSARQPAAGWVPKQHGAHAMLVVPYVVGLLLASHVRPLNLGDALLGLTWFVGYLAFNAASLWLKSAPKRRARYAPAVATYSLLAAALGAGTLFTKGLDLLWWTPLYAVLLGWALYLAAKRQDRSMTSGVLTVLAASGLMLVLRFGTPQGVYGGLDEAGFHDLWVALAVTGYFIGTIYHVKALIRERNDPAAAKRSAAYHFVLSCLVTGAAVSGWLGWGWAAWSVLLTVRAIVLPQQAATRRLRPMQIGLIEIFFSAMVVVLTLLG